MRQGKAVHWMLLVASSLSSTAATALPAGAAQLDSSCPLSQTELYDGGGGLTNALAPSKQRSLVNCTWYRDSTCCTPEDTLRISHSEPEISLLGSSRGCRDALGMLMCAPCNPDQALLFMQESVAGFPVATLRACEPFCDRLYTSCSSALLKLAGGLEPDRVDALFADGPSFCRAAGLRVVSRADHGACFSAAASWRRPGAAAGFAVAAIAAAAMGGRGHSIRPC
jgi:hypothetical protein